MFGSSSRRQNRARFSRKTVSKEFRNLVKQLLPGLGGHEIYWRLTQYLLFPGRRDAEGRILVDRDTLAKICNQPVRDSSGKYFSGIEVLNNYRRRVLPTLKWSDYNYFEERARVITHLEWPTGLKEALEKEKRMLCNTTGAVYFDTGLAFTHRRKKEHREYDRKEALEHMAMGGCAEAKTLLRYMNNLPSNRFEKMIPYLEVAQEKVDVIEDCTVRERQLDILKSIAIQPQPYYTSYEHTVRIYAHNTSVLNLKRNLRAVITQDFVGLDLRSAQLSIAATVWDIPSISELLLQGVKLWDYLWIAMDCPDDKEGFKDVIKKAIYGLMFGMSKVTLRKGNKDKPKGKYEGLDTLLAPYKLDGKRFLAIPVIKDILEARKRVYEGIEQAGGARDVFGKWIAITDEIGVNSVAAQIMQSYELFLMYPIVQAAEITSEFHIVLWVHDGCYIDVKDARRLRLWIERLQKAVKARASEIGVITELDVKTE